MKLSLAAAAMIGAITAAPASASETIDIGVVQASDVRVVQKLLYPKTGRSEIGLHLGLMPFDAYVTTPNAQISFDQHLSETLAISVVGGGGYSFRTAVMRQLESPTYGVAPYAFRYLGSVLGGVQWAPIYAKMKVGRSIRHFDVYLTARAGVTVESSLIPNGGTPIAPTFSPGGGARVFLSPSLTLRAELRDDILIQSRPLTESTAIKQNANITVGLTVMPGAKS